MPHIPPKFVARHHGLTSSGAASSQGSNSHVQRRGGSGATASGAGKASKPHTFKEDTHLARKAQPLHTSEPDSMGEQDAEDGDRQRRPLVRSEHFPLSKITDEHIFPFRLCFQDLGPIHNSGFDKLLAIVQGHLELEAVYDLCSNVGTIYPELQSARLAEAWKRQVDKRSVVNRLTAMRSSPNKKTYDWAKEVITEIVDVVKWYCNTQPGGGRRTIVCHSDMVLATKGVSSKKSGAVPIHKALTNPARIVRARFKDLKVTGSASFMMFNLMSSMEKAKHCLNKRSNLDAAAAVLYHQDDPLSTNILPIQVVSAAKDLKDAEISRIIAISLISMAKTSREIMPWVLSNGNQWLFGITNKREWRFKFCKTDLMMCGNKAVVGELLNPDSNDIKAMMAKAELNMKMLTLWSYARPANLWVAMDAETLQQESRKHEGA